MSAKARKMETVSLREIETFINFANAAYRFQEMERAIIRLNPERTKKINRIGP